MNVDRVGRSGIPEEPSAEPIAEAPPAPAAATVRRGTAPSRPGHAPGHGAAAFSTGRSLGVLTLDHRKWERFELAPPAAATAKKLNPDAYLLVTLADFKVSPAALATAPRDGARIASEYHPRPTETSTWVHLGADQRKWINFVHDALLASTAADYYEKFDPKYEETSAKRVSLAHALRSPPPEALYSSNGCGPDELKDLRGPKLAAAQKKATDLTAAYRSAVEAMGRDPDIELYAASWNNMDDSSYDGLLGINRKTGEVRTLVAINPS